MMRAPRKRWTDGELDLAADLDREASDIAAELGRSLGSVTRMRARLAGGWSATTEHTPLTDADLDYIGAHPAMTAQTVADNLGVNYGAVTKARRSLARSLGISFGVGPYDKDPNVVGQRLLLGKTCSECGVLRGGADFHKSRTTTMSACRYCRAEMRSPDDRQAREQRVQHLAPLFDMEYRAHHCEEYTNADMGVLADLGLTITEKAAQLGRTYAAASIAVQNFGFSSRIEPRPEPRGVWVIDGPTEASASVEPDRQAFGKRMPKTHCVHGHEFTPETTYVRAGRARDCLTCRHLRNKARAKADATA